MLYVFVIGAGLAGCEAALAIARYGIPVVLKEMKPQKFTPAHKNPHFAELVCSNSLKSMRVSTASGLLKKELELLGSQIIDVAQQTRVPAGDALAVHRDEFARRITEKINRHPLIRVVNEEQQDLLAQDELCIIATGPLTSQAFAAKMEEGLGEKTLNFFDAAAPIVTNESLDTDKVFCASRYNKGDADYLNCAMNQEEYDRFYEALVHAEVAPLKDFEREEFKFFSGCMPVEVMAKKGKDTLRFGPLKPVGIIDPRTNKRAYAIVQLRQENKNGSLLNLVGFQTNLKWGEQKRVFRLIPGLQNAEFARYGVMHRNTFINSPKLLDEYFRYKRNPNWFFAGQITGVEGYLESAASGLLAALHLVRLVKQLPLLPLPETTMVGALAAYISKASNADFQPMNSNMGLLPPLALKIESKQEKKEKLAERAICDLGSWYETYKTVDSQI
ncbi:MAG: methylenetetrahydrofolate--tRNA-(uracil(54)-C(5))-methyltransferase (FADH(2)-oxidizing) TrmFO [Oscillospiraceae bacterium]|nr:methylenetetrahydrofolate--tRNA-(uracil(54)-C(5))-methyltransferase (FADH(2)-oxidizing) TrmFO [Oscillospiraceae bacterium]